MNVGDRVLITARSHPWANHTGTITDETPPPNLGFAYVVEFDRDGTRACVGASEIRRLAGADE